MSNKNELSKDLTCSILEQVTNDKKDLLKITQHDEVKYEKRNCNISSRRT